METQLNALIKSGFTKKMALYYLSIQQKEISNPLFNAEFVNRCHKAGFLAESAIAYKLSANNINQYLSDYDYYRIWPLNSWSRIWVNDKLTLKLALKDDSVMPEYYWYYADSGLKPLTDLPQEFINPKTNQDSFLSFVNHLSSCGTYACKPCNGSGSDGFFKITYIKENKFELNNKTINIDQLKSFVSAHINYLYTEYIRPCEEFALISPLIHTLRIVTINTCGYNPVIIGGYLRFATPSTGEANYTHLDESPDYYIIHSELDIETGRYKQPIKYFYDHVEDYQFSSSRNSEGGYVPYWEDVVALVHQIAIRFSNIEYMGFDIGITNKGIRIMEINTHPGIKYMQISKGLLNTPIVKQYFNNKISQVDNMSVQERKARQFIMR